MKTTGGGVCTGMQQPLLEEDVIEEYNDCIYKTL